MAPGQDFPMGPALSFQLPRKQLHAAKCISDRLKDEHGFDGGHTILKGDLRERRRVTREILVIDSHAAQPPLGSGLPLDAGTLRVNQQSCWKVTNLTDTEITLSQTPAPAESPFTL